MSNIGITRMISDLFFGSSRERVKNNGRQMMSKKLIALTIVALIGFSLCSIALAKKPPPPPPPPPDADPAIAYVLNGGIWVMDADGSNNTPVIERIYAQRPRWSPDGLKLAFSSRWPDGDWGIYTVNLDGTGLFPVTTTQSLKEWSPGDVLDKGEKILCVAQDGSDPYDPCDLFLISPDGTGLVRLTNTPDIYEGTDASWSPDGKSIAAICFNEESYLPQWLSVYELGLDEDGNIYVENTINVNDEAADYGVEYPTYLWPLEWAHTQNKVVTLVPDATTGKNDIWTLDLVEPYEMRRITGEGREAHFPDAYVRHSTWSPDDSRIAFEVRASGRYKKLAGIYVVDAATGENMEKLEDGACSEPEWYRYAE